MSSTPTQKQINTVLSKMLYAYEALIESPEKNIKKWHEYGDADGCLLCRLFRNGPEPFKLDIPVCTGCPLSLHASLGCKHATMYNLMYAINQYELLYSTSLNNVKTAANQRYQWLLGKIDAAGYEYK